MRRNELLSGDLLFVSLGLLTVPDVGWLLRTDDAMNDRTSGFTCTFDNAYYYPCLPSSSSSVAASSSTNVATTSAHALIVISSTSTST
jgi:hypothetical protein